MIHTFFSRLSWFALLLLLQVWVFNHIHILGYATPLPYVYILLLLSNETPRSLAIFLGFAMGLSVDMFTNTPGMAAATLCLCGFLQRPLLRLFTPSDKLEEEITPSVQSLKWSGFLLYALCFTLIHCSLYFLIEAFSFSNWPSLLGKVGGSTVITLLFVVVFEVFHSRKKTV